MNNLMNKKKFRFFEHFFFKSPSKFSDFINFDDGVGNIISKCIKLCPVFYSLKDLNLIKKDLFLVKKLFIQVIISMIMINPSSERIFNPSRYTGINVIKKTMTYLYWILHNKIALIRR